MHAYAIAPAKAEKDASHQWTKNSHRGSMKVQANSLFTTAIGKLEESHSENKLQWNSWRISANGAFATLIPPKTLYLE